MKLNIHVLITATILLRKMLSVDVNVCRMCTVLYVLTISCNKTVSNEIEYTRADNSDYITKKDVKCRWKDNFREDYTSAFNIYV